MRHGVHVAQRRGVEGHASQILSVAAGWGWTSNGGRTHLRGSGAAAAATAAALPAA